MTKWLLIVLGIVLLVLQYRLWIGAGSWADVARLKEAIKTQQESNASLEARNTTLANEVDDLKTGLESVEERARSEFGLIKEGETFYLIVDEETASKKKQ